jgi:hypothetical protein
VRAASSARAAAAGRDGSSAGNPQPGLLIPLMLAAVLIPALLGSSRTIFNDGDVSWHIATGQWILAHRAIPHSDPFSFTWAGKPWVPIEWFAEVIFAGVYRLFDYAGVAALVTAALMGLHALIFLNASRFVHPWMGVATLVLMDLVLVPMTLARPHLLVWPLLALWTWLMLRARENDRAPPLVAALLMVLWANLHGSFVVGIGIVALFGLEALVLSTDRIRALKQWLPFGLLCLLAIFVNANGVEGVFHPFRMASLAMLPLINEWKPSSFDVTPFFFEVLLLVAVLIAWKRPRLPWMLGLAMFQMRHQATLAILAAMLLPIGFAQTSAAIRRPDRSVAAVAILAAVLLVGVRALLPITPAENEANPWKLIAAVPAEYRSQPVFNGYSMGGPLILSGIRPFIDGRGDMYGDEVVARYVPVIHGDPAAFDETVQRWNIGWAIVPHRRDKLIRLLDRSPEWRKAASDEAGVVYVRRSPIPSGGPQAPR